MTRHRDVEDLLRATLADERRRLETDGVSLVGGARDGALRIRRRRSAAGAAGVMVAVVVAIAAVGALVHLPSEGSRTVQPALPTGSPAPSPTRTVGATAPATSVSPWWRDVPEAGTAPTDYPGQVEDLAAGNGVLFVLAVDPPARVDALDPVTAKVLWSRALPVLERPSGGGGVLRLDPSEGVLWAYRLDETGPCRVDAVDAGSGGPAGGADVPCGVTDLAAEGGRLWAAYGAEVHVLRQGASTFATVAGTDGAFSLGVDRRRDRVLVTLDGSRVVALDARTEKVVASGPLAYGKSSVAITPDGDLWVAGYGGDTLGRRDPQTLAPVGGSPVAETTGPGAQVWAGDTVVWVRNGGDVGLTCVAAKDGTPLARWSQVQGPVVSASGPARAWAVNERTLVRLVLPPGCRG